jgi:hypothetical protein
LTNNRFVRIDCAEKAYTVYVDGKAVNSIESAEFLAAGFIERFRVHTDDVMKMVDGEEETKEEREKRLLQTVLDRADKLDW